MSGCRIGHLKLLQKIKKLPEGLPLVHRAKRHNILLLFSDIRIVFQVLTFIIACKHNIS
jgi:hypothetical protein